MTTFYCDIDESATATSSLLSGITTLLEDSANARDLFIMVVASLAFSTGTASSTLIDSVGFNAVDSAVASSELISQTNATNIAVDEAVAFSGLDREVTEIILSNAAAADTLISSTDSLDTSAGEAQALLLAGATREQLVVEQASASSALVEFNETLVVSSGAGTSALLSSVLVSTLDVVSATASTQLLADADTDGLLLAQAVASSEAFSTAVLSDVLVSEATGAALALLPVANAAWVVNTQSMAMTRYTGLGVESLATVGGKVLALGGGQLFEMTGTTDDGKRIKPSILTGMSMLGAAALKQLGDIIVSYVCAGTMAVRISTYGSGKDGTWTYTMPPRRAEAPRANRLTPGKGLRGRYFRFEFTTLDGAAFDVDTVTADVAVNTRRI